MHEVALESSGLAGVGRDGWDRLITKKQAVDVEPTAGNAYKLVALHHVVGRLVVDLLICSQQCCGIMDERPLAQATNEPRLVFSFIVP